METSTLAVVRNIYLGQPITRLELCERTGLSQSRVGVLVSQLREMGLVCGDRPANGSPGRPAALLTLNPKAGHVVGLDIGGEHMRAVLSDLQGSVLFSAIHPTRAVPDREVILENLTNLVEAICEKGGLQPDQLVALGMGLRGIVDTRAGMVLDWPNTPEWADAWRNLDIKQEIGSRLGVKLILVDEPVRAMAVTAHRFGPAQGCDNFLYLFLGGGVGSAVFVDGQPYGGNRGMAGELGHVIVDEDGPWCSCGNRGCLEVLASTSAVLRRARQRLADPQHMSILRTAQENGELSVTTLIEAAAVGDKLAFQVLNQTGSYVGKVVAVAINMLDPELVVLGGPLAMADGFILDAVQHQVRLRALQYIYEETRLVCDHRGELDGAPGMALLALDKLFGTRAYLEAFLDTRLDLSC